MLYGKLVKTFREYSTFWKQIGKEKICCNAGEPITKRRVVFIEGIVIGLMRRIFYNEFIGLSNNLLY